MAKYRKYKAIGLILALIMSVSLVGCTKHATTLTLDKPTLTIENGQTFSLVATILPLDAEQAIIWSISSNSGNPVESETISSTSLTNEFKAVSQGEATITVTTENNKTASCVVTVSENAEEKAVREKAEAEAELKKQEEAKINGGGLVGDYSFLVSSTAREVYISVAQGAVQDNLKSPYSAVFGDCKLIQVDDYGRGLVYIEVDSQNSFGAMIRGYYIVVMQTINTSKKTGTYNTYYGIQSFGQKWYDGAESSLQLQTIRKANFWNQPLK